MLEGGQQIVAHKQEFCQRNGVKKRGRPCPIHARSEHHMRSWPQNWRTDKYAMERTCPHGVGHPDPDDPNNAGVHGCDGCCRRPV